MNIRRCLLVMISLGLALILTYLPATGANAQANLGTPQKLQYINAAIKWADESVAKGDTARARFSLLAATEMVSKVARIRGNQQVVNTVNAYMAARSKAWPGVGPKPDMAKMQAWAQQISQNKEKLKALSQEFKLSPPPSGRREYWKKVATIIAMENEATGFAAKVCADAPPPDHFLTNRPLLQKFMPVFMALQNIAYGPALARMHAKEKVIPALVAEAKEKMAQAQKTKDVMLIGADLGQAQEAIDLLAMLDPGNPGLTGLKDDMKKSRERLQKIYDEQLAQNRMPGDNYKGADKQAVINEATEIYKKVFPGEEIILIKVPSDAWAEAWEGWWEKNVWHAAYAGYIDVAFAAKSKEGVERVYVERFRRIRNADGWSPMKHWRNIANYRILPENIK